MSKGDNVRDLYEQALPDMLRYHGFKEAAMIMYDLMKDLAQDAQNKGQQDIARKWISCRKQLGYAIDPPQLQILHHNHKHGDDIKIFILPPNTDLPNPEQFCYDFEPDDESVEWVSSISLADVRELSSGDDSCRFGVFDDGEGRGAETLCDKCFKTSRYDNCDERYRTDEGECDECGQETRERVYVESITEYKGSNKYVATSNVHTKREISEELAKKFIEKRGEVETSETCTFEHRLMKSGREY